MKTTIYKANGQSFNSMDDVQKYAEKHNYYISKTSSFKHKGTNVVCCDLQIKGFNTGWEPGPYGFPIGYFD